MKKTIIFLVIVGLLIAVGVWWWNTSRINRNNQQAESDIPNYQAERSVNNTTRDKDTNTNIPVTKKETEISNFSTKIYNKDEKRQNNIGIACRTVSTKEVQPGETFSFCSTVGKATAEKGYQEADIYVEGKKEQGIGGGMCQVSTTLYNAVLQVPELEVIERHQHSGNVPYIEKGKDAAISYGIYDLKFKNNTGDTIKIIMENTADNITAKLIKIEK